MADWRSVAETGFKPVLCMIAAAEVGEAAAGAEDADEAAGVAAGFADDDPPAKAAALPLWGAADAGLRVEGPEAGAFLSAAGAPTDSLPAFVAGATMGFEGSAGAFATKLWAVLGAGEAAGAVAAGALASCAGLGAGAAATTGALAADLLLP